MRTGTNKKSLFRFISLLLTGAQVASFFSFVLIPSAQAKIETTKIIFNSGLVTVIEHNNPIFKWSESQNALEKNLVAEAQAAEFSKNNSAVLRVVTSALEVSLPVDAVPTPSLGSIPPPDASTDSSGSGLPNEDVILAEPSQLQGEIISTSPSQTTEVAQPIIPSAEDGNTVVEVVALAGDITPADLTPLPQTDPAFEEVLNLLEDNTKVTPIAPSQQSAPEFEDSSNNNNAELLSAPALEFSQLFGQGTNNLATGTILQSLQVKLSLVNLSLPTSQLNLEYSLEDSTWQTVGTIDTSIILPDDYVSFSLPNDVLKNIDQLRLRLTYKLENFAGQDSAEVLYIDGVWLEAEYLNPAIVDEEVSDLQDSLEAVTPEDFSHIDFLSSLLELSMPSSLENPITLNTPSLAESNLQMLIKDVSKNSTSARQGDTITYSDAFTNTDLVYEFKNNSLKENIVLKSKIHPSKFRYLLNLDKYDYELTDNKLVLFKQGHKGESLYKRYVISAPIMIDANGITSQEIKLFVSKNTLTVTPDSHWLSEATYPVIVDPTVEITILNVHSHPAEGQYWDVDFATVGTADLTITPADQATVDDDEFSSLFCGSEDRTSAVQILPGDVLYFPNWSCEEIARVSHYTIRAGSHHLLFDFGGQIADAFNATYTWDGGGGDANWTTAANWSSNIVPTPSDSVTIDNSCATNCNPTINTTTSISAFTISSATTTVTQPDSFIFTVTGGFTMSNGIFYGGNGTTTYSNSNFTISGGTYNAATNTVFSTGSFTVNINSTQNLHNLFFINTGTKTISSGDLLIVAGTLTLSDGAINTGGVQANGNITQASTFDGGSALIDFGDNSVAQTYTINGGSAPSIRFDSSSDANDSVVFNASSGFTTATTTSAFSGTIPFSNPSNFDLSFGTWQQAAGTFNGGTSTTTISTGFTLSGSAVYNSASTTVFTAGGGMTITLNGTQNFNHLTFAGTQAKTISGTAVVLGNLFLNSSGSFGTVNSGIIDVRGNITQASTNSGGGTAVIDFGDNSVSQIYTINGGAGPVIRFDNASDASDTVVFTAAAGFSTASTTSDFSGTIPFSNPSNFDISIGNWLQAAGTFSGGTGTTSYSTTFTVSGSGVYNAASTTLFSTGTGMAITPGGTTTFYNATFAGTQAKTITGTLVANGLVYFSGTGAFGGTTGGTIDARGNVLLVSNSSNISSALQFTGTANQTFTLTGITSSYDGDVTVNKTSGTVSLASDLLMNANSQDLILTAGTLDLNGNNVAATGTSGTLTAASGATLKLIGSETISANANNPSLSSGSTVEYYGTSTSYTLKNYTYGGLTISGSGGTFAPASSTLNVLGAFTQTAGTFNASSTMNLGGNFSRSGGTFNHNSGTVTLNGGSQSIYGSTTFNNLTKSTSTAYTLTFASSTTQTIVGTLTLSGASGQRLSLRSDSTGTQWKIDPQSTRTISFLDVKDSNNINATVISAGGTNSVNSGNTTNWDFGSTFTQTDYRFYQNGDVLQPSVTLGSLSATTTINSTSSPIRLRLNLTIGDVALATTSQTFILQVATSTTGSWSNVGSTTLWSFYNNTSVSDGATISSTLLATSNVQESYGENNPTAANPNAIAVGQLGEWDFALDPSGATVGYFYFRVVKSDGTVLNSYTNYVSLLIDTVSPTPGTITVATTSSTSLTASITGASDALSGLSATPYIFYNTTASTNSSATTSTSWLSSSLTPNTQYTFYIQVSDLAGNTATTSNLSRYTLANIPTTTIATADSDTQITLSFNANSNPNGTEYYVLNSTASTTSGWITATSYSFSGLTCNTSYSFNVKARNNDGFETASTSGVSETTSACASQSSDSNSSGSGSGGGGLPVVPSVDPIPPVENNPPVDIVIVTPNVPTVLPPVNPSGASLRPPVSVVVSPEPIQPEPESPIIPNLADILPSPAEVAQVGKAAVNSVKSSAARIWRVTVEVLKDKQTTVGAASLVVAPLALTLQFSISSFGLLVGSIASPSDLWLYLLRALFSLSASLGFRKRRRYWGTVYDSVTKQPLDPAMVELIDVATGKVVGTAITDLEGRFGFFDLPGQYIIRVRKSHYSFPSRNITGRSDSVFENLYHGEILNITASGAVLAPNIPMDPMEFDWNQEEKKKLVQFNTHLDWFVIKFLSLVFWVGFVLVLVMVLTNPTKLNYLFGMVYLVLAFLRKFIPHPELWGSLRSKNFDTTGLYLELSPQKIPNVILAKTVTSRGGRFFLKTPPGEFILRVKRINGTTVEILHTQTVTVKKSGVLNQMINI